jgi:hypothetical protein
MVHKSTKNSVNKMLEDRNRRTIPFTLFEILSPLYKVFGALTGKGDFMTVWAKMSGA